MGSSACTEPIDPNRTEGDTSKRGIDSICAASMPRYCSVCEDNEVDIAPISTSLGASWTNSADLNKRSRDYVNDEYRY